MDAISDVDTITLSEYLNEFRKYLLTKGFFEHHLYSLIPYKIESTNSFQVTPELHLRYNPEPDVWRAGIKYDKFFWIGSMYRKEPELGPLHKYEFTVVDIYLKNADTDDVFKQFVLLLKVIERKFKLPELSEEPVKKIDYQMFQKNGCPSYNGWLIVENYPIEESFYDELAKGNATKKFEIFHIQEGTPIEIAACGVLGHNSNKQMFIKNEGKIVDLTSTKKNFTGFGFGVERLILVYAKNKKH